MCARFFVPMLGMTDPHPPAVEEEDESFLPTWMRYLPKTPWNSQSVHCQLHLEETSHEIRRRKLRVRGTPPKLPPSSNPFVVDFQKIDEKKGKKRSNEESNENNDQEIEQQATRRRVVRPKRNVTSSSIDEMSMLVSFCKVEKMSTQK